MGEVQLSTQLLFSTWQDRVQLRKNNFQHREAFSKVRVFCLFVGYPRSGHSLVSSLIDAHPNAVISHRLDALKYFESKLDLNSIFYLISRNSQRFAKRGRKLTRYRYKISGQWQGQFSELHVIGDQEGRMTTKRLGENPAILSYLVKNPDISIKFIHVIRNPYDNISRWATRTKQSLEFTAKRYFSLCRTVQQIRKSIDAEQLLEIHHEVFLRNPEAGLNNLCHFLDLEATDEYVNACTSIVYPNPNQSRYNLAWPSSLIKSVEDEIKKFDYLKEYSFDA